MRELSAPGRLGRERGCLDGRYGGLGGARAEWVVRCAAVHGRLTTTGAPGLLLLLLLLLLLSPGLGLWLTRHHGWVARRHTGHTRERKLPRALFSRGGGLGRGTGGGGLQSLQLTSNERTALAPKRKRERESGNWT
jgi:hypothetical protein